MLSPIRLDVFHTHSSDEEKNTKHITFTVNDACGTFVFAKETETSENNNKEEALGTEPASTETADIVDTPENTDNVTADAPASTPEKPDSSKDLSVVKQINDFLWKGGIGGQDLAIKVSIIFAFAHLFCHICTNFRDTRIIFMLFERNKKIKL